MSEITYEQVLIGIQSLPPESRARLRDVLDAPDESNFRRLADQWLRETEHISSVKEVCMHPAYQRIIGMGPAAVPYLLRELEQAPDHWFWALRAITGADPAQTEDSVDGARTAWLKWGREEGYL